MKKDDVVRQENLNNVTEKMSRVNIGQAYSTKNFHTSSESRPLVVDDDDSDLDLEIDENIDTSVSNVFIYQINICESCLKNSTILFFCIGCKFG